MLGGVIGDSGGLLLGLLAVGICVSGVLGPGLGGGGGLEGQV